MTKKENFSVDEQLEIINIIKGIFRYAKMNKKVLANESMFLELLEESCIKVSYVIKDMNKK